MAQSRNPNREDRPARDAAWTLHPSELAEEARDPLLGSLVALTKLFGRPHSPAALAAGLPLEDGRFTPELFVRAAERIGLSARRTVRQLEEIPDMVLPTVLLLKSGSACVFLKRKGTKAALLLPETGEGVVQMDLERLAEQYAGYAIFVRPQLMFSRVDGRDGDAQPQEGLKRGWFWGTLAKFWPTYSQVILAAVLINCFVIAMPLFIRNVYDRVVPNQAFETLWVLAVGMVIVLVFDLVLQVLRGYFLDTAGKRADVLISSRIFAHVLNMQMSRVPKSAGGFASRLREFEALRDFITSATLVTLVDLPFVFLFLFVIWLIGGPIVLIPLAVIPIVLLTGILVQLPLRSAVQRSLEESSQKHGMIVESLNALDTVKSLSMEGRLQREWERQVAQSADTSLWVRTVAGIGMHLSRVGTQVVTLGTVIYGVYLISTGALSVGGLIACTIIAGRAMSPITQIAGLLARFNQAAAAYKALGEIMEMPVDRAEGRQYLSRKRLHGEIEFRNVTFSYPGAKTPALRNVSFKIKPGERVGFIGPIGSGKTTIGRLVNGLYLPDEGSILIDGTDIRQIDPTDLRRNIGVVQQDIVLFRGSVRENVAMGAPHADDSMILQASELSGVHDFVGRHPLGYELPVGEKGRELSGGQRQSIALARAILLDPPIFLMDEPTSMMDVQSENHFIKRIGKVIKGRTMMVITHRPSLFPLVERIIVLKNGRVAMDAPRDKVESLGREEAGKAAKKSSPKPGYPKVVRPMSDTGGTPPRPQPRKRAP